MKIKYIVLNLITLIFLSGMLFSQDIQWKHLSTKTNDLQVPNEGNEQTSSIVCDIDKDGVSDFVISERTRAPSVVSYRHIDKNWDRYIIESAPLHIEAGSDFSDIDGYGKANFKEMIISEGFGMHESKIADLDGDGDYDILGKPYNWDTSRLDIWLQDGTGEPISKRAHSFNKPVGLELYALRFEFKKDLPGAFEKVKNFGFKEVEVSGYYNTDPKEFKKLLDKNRLKTTSMIFGYDRLLNDLENVIKEARLFGTRTIGCGWIPHNGKFSFADAEKTVRDLNSIGHKLKDAGITFFYHPHGYEFVYDHYVTLMDYIMDNTKPEFVSLQFDPFWVLYAGMDPLWFLKKYPARFTACHLKDLHSGIDGGSCGTAPDVTSVALGNSLVNFPAFLREAVKLGITKYYIEDEAEDAVDHLPISLKFSESLK